MTIVVFLGPSLPLAEARRQLPDAVYLPPCAMGDVYQALQRHRPRAIGIVDGLFERTPSVWHKEILHAMSEGVAVFGGASMGALRAAELAAFGMRGVGRIFEDLASGRLEDDDEVAVSHLDADSGFKAQSEPMVNLRFALELARAQGLVDADEEGALIAAMKALYYPQRSWPALFDTAAGIGLPAGRVDALRALVEQRRPDRKRDDAVAVLQALRQWRRDGAAPPAAPFEFESTLFWEHLVSHHGTAASSAAANPPSRHTAGGGAVSRERLVQHLRLGAPDREAVLGQALLLELAEQAARRLNLPAVDDRAALARFRHDRGLHAAAALSQWMARQGVDAAQCLELARAEARLRALHWRLQEQVDLQLPRALQLRGSFDRAVSQVQSQWQRLHELGIDQPAESDVASLDDVLVWYQRRFGPVHGELDAHIVERGFGTTRQFVTELLARYLAEHAVDAGAETTEEVCDATA